ncbi:hypothetical protein Y032_0008g387 [Ancylostoma ceylanicum]|uniref:Uncharacterized protein n=1 Tax=Ancylostoma ceylanicum TaxID=53326 RepID=A0A016VN62_9BILA|nr:hypothetical protein Y032_0008g387 [Ancylostoma ceylanicum]
MYCQAKFYRVNCLAKHILLKNVLSFNIREQCERSEHRKKPGSPALAGRSGWCIMIPDTGESNVNITGENIGFL